jgi:hypothetical protein
VADAPIVLEVRHHDAGGALPTVVLFHGYGSTPDDIVHLYDGYPGPLRVPAVRTRAPRPHLGRRAPGLAGDAGDPGVRRQGPRS